ncbi:thymidine phosphorylase [Bacteroidota bacterium]
MTAVELIRKKRDGYALTKSEIMDLIGLYTEGLMPDYQFSAFLMAAFLRGMNKSETTSLTSAMLYSGQVIDLSLIKGAKIDKHSTGGVGDKTSLILAPIVSAAGIFVPMISGRGLGHTGGTLDKLESIPGFSTSLTISKYKTVLQKCGAVLIGQTKNIAPADKLIYALRDVTATVESIPLITASIMSKKLAEGIDGLVLDVKTGTGAFMRKTKDAKELTNSLINTAKMFKKKVIAFITDMNQPLGHNIGNWLEVVESVNVLKGEQVDDLVEVTLNLSGAMIYLGGKAKSLKEGIKISKDLIANGKAYQKFLDIVEIQGGDISYIENLDKYPKPKHKLEVVAEQNGFIKSIDNYEIGMASLELGAGRLKKEEVIDPAAGIIFKPKIGDKIKKGDLIATLYCNDNTKINEANNKILSAIKISKTKAAKPKLIKEIIY